MPHAYSGIEGIRGHPIPWNCSYRWWRAAVWVLEWHPFLVQSLYFTTSHILSSPFICLSAQNEKNTLCTCFYTEWLKQFLLCLILRTLGKREKVPCILLESNTQQMLSIYVISCPFCNGSIRDTETQGILFESHRQKWEVWTKIPEKKLYLLLSWVRTLESLEYCMPLRLITLG